MKIAFFSSGLAYRLGGPSFSEAFLIKELRKSITVDVYVPHEYAETEFLEDHQLEGVIRYYKNQVLDYSDRIKVADVIHLNGHWKWWYSKISRFAVLNGIPYVLHPRGMMLVGHRKKQIKRVFNFALGNGIVQNASCVIALSEYEKTQFSPYHLPKSKLEVIPNPIEVSPQKLFEKPALPRGVKSYFLYLGRIEVRKNLVFLVEGFKEYKRIGGASSLLITGPVERHYDAKVREAIRRNSLEKDVYVLPPAYGSNRDQLLQHSVGLVYPATDEPFGRVPFEGVAVGTIPIVPDFSGAAEYLGPFFPECIYRENNVVDFGKTLMAAEGLDRSRVEEAQEWVTRNLNSTAIAQRILSVYEGVRTSSPIFEGTPPLQIRPRLPG